MKNYKKIHDNKEVADNHVSKIKKSNGKVKKSILKNGKILLEYSYPDKNIFFHGSNQPLNLTINSKPIFLTQDENYAKEYGRKIFKYKIDFKKIFDTAKDKNAVKIYNQFFLPYAKEKFKSELHRFIEMKLGEHVHFITADYLWLFLRISKRNNNDFGYDGIIVDEGFFSVSKKSRLSYVPLDIIQVRLV